MTASDNPRYRERTIDPLERADWERCKAEAARSAAKQRKTDAAWARRQRRSISWNMWPKESIA